MTREISRPPELKTVNCLECMDLACSFKKYLNEINYSEVTHVVCDRFKKERILNPDIAEFFWNCCKMERLK